MADACCADDGCTDRDLDDDGPASFWAVGEGRRAAASGALLAGGLVAGALDATAAETVLFLVALAVGGSTFVPDTLRALARGKLGVGTLMTIAAIGAVILGELGEAASLAFLFSRATPWHEPAAACEPCWPWSRPGSPSCAEQAPPPSTPKSWSPVT